MSELLGLEVVLDVLGLNLDAINVHAVVLQKLRGGVIPAENVVPTSGYPLVA